MLDQSPARTPGREAAPGFITAPMIVAVGIIAALSVTFAAFPAIDLSTSRVFYAPGQGFFLASEHALVAFRNSIDVLLALAVVLILANLAVKLARPERASLIAPSLVLFLVSSLILGPGFLVNVVLKDHWGRPRPSTIAAFGGGNPYIPVWEISRFCSRNCSFVAGEPSAAAWLIGAALVLPPRWRLPGMIVAGVYAVLIGVNRIAFGGHFLSDVLLSFSLTFLVMALLHRLFVERPPAVLANPLLEANLTALGRRLRATERSPVAKR
jgi:membrane-associated PAP2 superfamily phosphatase